MKLYNVPLLQYDDSIVKVLAMGKERIMENLQAIKHKPTKQMFQNVNSDNLIQPIRQVDLLIGI